MDWCAQACKQKFLSLYLCEQIKNVMWQRTDFYCLLPPVPSLFHPWPWRRAFSSTPLLAVLFLSISSRLPPSCFLLSLPPPYFSLLKHSSWYGASFSSSFFNCHSFYQPSFLWLVLVSSFLCSERFMLNYFSDQLLKLGSMLSKKTERKDKKKTSRKPFRIKCFFQE